MTGRQMGPCVYERDMPGYPQSRCYPTRPLWGQRPLGGGFGHRHWFYATGLPRWARWASPEWPKPGASQTEEVLKARADSLRQALAEVERDLSQLKGSETEQPGE